MFISHKSNVIQSVHETEWQCRRMVKGLTKTGYWAWLEIVTIDGVSDYSGETGYILPFLGFIIWMGGWLFILYEIFSGEAGKILFKSSNDNLISAFTAMRLIVTVGWAVYPLGYVFGYLTGGFDSSFLNVIYNFADFINKIAFGKIIWVAAK